jgi:hypothetical protein
MVRLILSDKSSSELDHLSLNKSKGEGATGELEEYKEEGKMKGDKEKEKADGMLDK